MSKISVALIGKTLILNILSAQETSTHQCCGAVESALSSDSNVQDLEGYKNFRVVKCKLHTVCCGENIATVTYAIMTSPIFLILMLVLFLQMKINLTIV